MIRYHDCIIFHYVGLTLLLNDEKSAIEIFKLLNKTRGKIASKNFKYYVYAYTQCKIYIPMSDDVFSSGWFFVVLLDIVISSLLNV